MLKDINGNKRFVLSDGGNKLIGFDTHSGHPYRCRTFDDALIFTNLKAAKEFAILNKDNIKYNFIILEVYLSYQKVWEEGDDVK